MQHEKIAKAAEMRVKYQGVPNSHRGLAGAVANFAWTVRPGHISSRSWKCFDCTNFFQFLVARCIKRGTAYLVRQRKNEFSHSS
jgi:hypothetical protein